MKKITALAALTVAGFSLATPAHADEDGNRPDHGRINIAGRPFTGDNLCRQAAGLVRFAAPLAGDSMQDACNNHEHPDRVRTRSEEPGSFSGQE
ncbi:hypothetical protein [Streptomyces sp. NPDC049099]|uniref:hypothetical protein n=1 Tax=unclassified Streptomyces TaxID=2593676 RepID=UPI00343A418D